MLNIISFNSFLLELGLNKNDEVINCNLKVMEDSTSYGLSSNALHEVADTIQNPKTDSDTMVKLSDTTPKVLVENFIPNLPLLVRKGHLKENILTKEQALKLGYSINSKKHYHGLGVKLYLKVIASLNDPIAIYKYTKKAKYNQNNYIIFTKVKDNNNKNIIVPIEINQKGQYNNVEIKINRIKTVYGRETNNYFNGKIRNNELIEIYKKH